jgi:hypothetical protein
MKHLFCLGLLLLAIFQFASSSQPTAAEFVTTWIRPQRMGDYDFRLADTDCKKQAAKQHGGSSSAAFLSRQASFEACMTGLGAKLRYRSLDGMPANGPMTADQLKRR